MYRLKESGEPHLPNVIHSLGLASLENTNEVYLTVGAHVGQAYYDAGKNCTDPALGDPTCMGQIWKTADGGETWEFVDGDDEHDITPYRVVDITRFQDNWVINDFALHGYKHRLARQDENGDWITIPTDAWPDADVRMYHYDGKIVAAATESNWDPTTNKIIVVNPDFSIETIELDWTPADDFNIFSDPGDGFLYALSEDGRLMRSSDLHEWVTVYDFGRKVVSISYWGHQNQFVLSTQGLDADLWLMDIPPQVLPTPTVTPTPLPEPDYFGQAIRFPLDGDNEYFSYPHQDNILSDAFTIEFWAKANQYDEHLTHWLFRKNALPGSDYSYQYGLFYRGNEMTLGASLGGGINTVSINNPLKDFLWHHFALVFPEEDPDDERVILYVDGVRRVALTSPSIPITHGTGNYHLGYKDIDVNTDSFVGEIDEFRHSNIVRYTENFPNIRQVLTPDQDTVTLYHFDNDVEDTSGVGQPGIITGNLTFIESTLGAGPSPTITPTPNPSETEYVVSFGPEGDPDPGWDTAAELLDTLNQVGYDAFQISTWLSPGIWLTYNPTSNIYNDNFDIVAGGGYYTSFRSEYPGDINSYLPSTEIYSVSVDLGIGFNYASFPSNILQSLGDNPTQEDLCVEVANQGGLLMQVMSHDTTNDEWMLYECGSGNAPALEGGTGYFLLEDTNHPITFTLSVPIPSPTVTPTPTLTPTPTSTPSPTPTPAPPSFITSVSPQGKPDENWNTAEKLLNLLNQAGHEAFRIDSFSRENNTWISYWPGTPHLNNFEIVPGDGYLISFYNSLPDNIHDLLPTTPVESLEYELSGTWALYGFPDNLLPFLGENPTQEDLCQEAASQGGHILRVFTLISSTDYDWQPYDCGATVSPDLESGIGYFIQIDPYSPSTMTLSEPVTSISGTVYGRVNDVTRPLRNARVRFAYLDPVSNRRVVLRNRTDENGQYYQEFEHGASIDIRVSKPRFYNQEQTVNLLQNKSMIVDFTLEYKIPWWQLLRENIRNRFF